MDCFSGLDDNLLALLLQFVHAFCSCKSAADETADEADGEKAACDSVVSGVTVSAPAVLVIIMKNLGVRFIEFVPENNSGPVHIGLERSAPNIEVN